MYHLVTKIRHWLAYFTSCGNITNLELIIWDVIWDETLAKAPHPKASTSRSQRRRKWRHANGIETKRKRKLEAFAHFVKGPRSAQECQRKLKKGSTNKEEFGKSPGLRCLSMGLSMGWKLIRFLCNMLRNELILLINHFVLLRMIFIIKIALYIK